MKKSNNNVNQPSTIGPASNNHRGRVSEHRTAAEEGCMQGEITLSSAPPYSPHYPHVL